MRDQLSNQGRVYAGRVRYTAAEHAVMMGGEYGEESANDLSVGGVLNELVTTMEGKIQRFAPYYFFCKAIDWADEDEYRWVVHSKVDEPHYMNFGRCLRGIAVGPKASKEDVEAIVAFAKRDRVPLVGVRWSFRGGGIIPILLRF